MTPQPPHLCPFCQRVFAHPLLMAEHRVGSPRRCLSAEEIHAQGLKRDRLGVWRRQHR